MEKWQKYYLRFLGGATLNMSIFVAYRLYMHYLKNKLTFVEQKDFKAIQIEPYCLIDFSSKTELLDLLDFTHMDDDLGERKCSFFKYKNVFVLLSRFESYKDNEYSVYIDVPGCLENNKTPSEIGQAFLEATQFNQADILWKNQDVDNFLTYWRGKNIAQERVVSQRRNSKFLEDDRIRTMFLAQKLYRLPLMDYKPRSNQKVYTLDFSKHEHLLESLVFEEQKDTSIACYLFDGVQMSIQRHYEQDSYQYDIYAHNKHTDKAYDFVRALGFRDVPRSNA